MRGTCSHLLFIGSAYHATKSVRPSGTTWITEHANKQSYEAAGNTLHSPLCGAARREISLEFPRRNTD